MKLTNNDVPKDIRIVIKGTAAVRTHKVNIMTLPLQTEFSRTEVGARNWPKAVKSMIRKKLNEGALTHVSSVEIKLCP